MGFLLDTNIVSMLSPSKMEASGAFLRWLEEQDGKEALFLSAVTVHEIERGVRLLELKGSNRKAEAIRLWLLSLMSIYDDKILPLDKTVAKHSGEIEAKAVSEGHNPGMADAIIAGTAAAHRLVIITRNLRHLRPLGVPVRSPEEIIA